MEGEEERGVEGGGGRRGRREEEERKEADRMNGDNEGEREEGW